MLQLILTGGDTDKQAPVTSQRQQGDLRGEAGGTANQENPAWLARCSTPKCGGGGGGPWSTLSRYPEMSDVAAADTGDWR